MKRTLLQLIIAILVLAAAVRICNAQPPQKICYQAVIRDANGRMLASKNITILAKIIRKIGNSNYLLYSERHSVTTNTQGLVTINIGTGTKVSGNWANITWTGGEHFIETDIDPNGGTNYTLNNKQSITSVPYALYAEKSADSFSGKYSDLTGLPSIRDTILKYVSENNYLTKDSLLGGTSVRITNIGGITANALIVKGEEVWQKWPGIQKGICYSSGSPPTYSDNRIVCEAAGDTFSCRLTGLISGSTYHIRPYVFTTGGIVYGPDTVVTTALLPNLCATRFVRDSEGNMYNTVQIGGQCWLRENLRCKKFSDGRTIRAPTEDEYTYRQSEFVPNDSLPSYGLLYSPKAIMDGDTSSSATPSGVQGICPQGWHLPSCDEWETLNSSLGGNVPASDFSVKAGGYYSVGHHLGQACIYCQFGETAFFATSEAGTAYVWTKGETKLKKKRCQSRQFISVRCVQD